MRLPVDNFEKWYIAQEFGNKTSYGYHDGIDLNLKTGGDSDLGQSLIAIANGEVTSVHSHTTKPTFGNHLHIKHIGQWGESYSHYAHCRDIYVKQGDKVIEGQVVATVGKSGTDFAHCHFAIKLEPTGIDGIAKTEEDLKKWTDPLPFIEKWRIQPNMDIPNYLKTLLQEAGLDLNNEGQFRSFWEKAKKYDEDIKVLNERVKSLADNVESLGTQVSALTEGEQKLRNKLQETEETLNTERDKFYQANKEALESRAQAETLQRQVDALTKEVEQHEKNNSLYSYSWWRRLFSLFRG